MTATKTSIPVELFGKDHWSTFAFLECKAVDNEGIISGNDRMRMRCNATIHPGLAHEGSFDFNGGPRDYPTRLRDGTERPRHDDWSCVEDMEEAGLIEWKGTGINPIIILTERGRVVAGKLRAHKQRGGTYNDFEPGAMV